MNTSGLEIERKFVIEYPSDEAKEKLLAIPGAYFLKITQEYLKAKEHESRRIRRSERDGKTVYYLTVKRGSGMVHEEDESEISEAEFARLSACADTELKAIHKTRLCIPSSDKLIEIDLYDDFYDYAIAEVELDFAEEKLPDMSMINIIREVTGIKKWSNHSMAKYGMPEK